MGKDIMSGQRCGKRIRISPLRSEYDPRDQQWLYVRGGGPLVHVGFLRVLWLPLNFIHRVDQKTSSVSHRPTFRWVSTVNRFCFFRDRWALPFAVLLFGGRRGAFHPEEKFCHLFEIDCMFLLQLRVLGTLKYSLCVGYCDTAFII